MRCLLLLLIVILIVTRTALMMNEMINMCNVGKYPVLNYSMVLQRDLTCMPSEPESLVMHSFTNFVVVWSRAQKTIHLFDKSLHKVTWRYHIGEQTIADGYVNSFVSNEGLLTIAFQPTATFDASLSSSIIQRIDMRRGALVWTKTSRMFHQFGISTYASNIGYLSVVVRNTSASSVNLNFDDCVDPLFVSVDEDYSVYILEMNLLTGCLTRNYTFVGATMPACTTAIAADRFGVVVARASNSIANLTRLVYGTSFAHSEWSRVIHIPSGILKLNSSPTQYIVLLQVGKIPYLFDLDTGKRRAWPKKIPEIVHLTSRDILTYNIEDINSKSLKVAYVSKIANFKEIWSGFFDYPESLIDKPVSMTGDRRSYNILFCDKDGSVFAQILEISCAKCPPGTFGVYVSKNSSFCVPCSGGTYSQKEGSLICAACPPGTYNPEEQGDSRDKCIPCPPGTFNLNERGISCTPCPSNYYADQGSEYCSPCPHGTHTNPALTVASNVSSCIPCPNGFLMTSDGSCQQCEANNTFCPVGSLKPVDLSKVQPKDAQFHYFNPSEDEFKRQKQHQKIKYSVIIPSSGFLLLFISVSAVLWVACFGGRIRDFDFMFPRFNYIRSGEYYKKQTSGKGALFTAIAISVASAAILISLYEYLNTNIFYNVSLAQGPVSYPEGKYEVTIRLNGATQNVTSGILSVVSSGWTQKATSAVIREGLDGMDVIAIWECSSCALGPRLSKLEVKYSQPGISAVSIDINVTVPWYTHTQQFVIEGPRLLASTDGSLVFKGTKPNEIFLTSSPSVFRDGHEESIGVYLQHSSIILGSMVGVPEFSSQPDEIHVHVSILHSATSILTRKLYKQSLLNVLAQSFSLVATIVTAMGFVLVRIDMIHKGCKYLISSYRERSKRNTQVIEEDSFKCFPSEHTPLVQ